MYKFLAGILLLFLTLGANAGQNPAKIYGPTLKEYAAVTCKLQNTRMGHNYQWMQLKQAKLMGKLQVQTGRLTPEQRLQYNKAYMQAMSCTQPKHKPLTAEQYSKLGCKDSKVSTKQYLTATAGDNKTLQALAKTQRVKNMYERELAKQMKLRRQALKRRGGVDPCKKYDPIDHIPN